MIKVTKCYGNSNMTPLVRRPKYIVIHYTAGASSKKGRAKDIAKYFNNPVVNSSADYIVDDKTIVKFNPSISKYYCWAVGGSKLNTKGGRLYGKCNNSNSISIEICSTNDTGKVTKPNDTHFSFTDDVIANAAELIASLMKKWNIPIENVVRHYDVTGKLCPGIKGWNKESGSESEWKKLIKKVKEVR